MPDLSHLRIVVVEDNEDSLFLLKWFLKSQGAQVDAYDSAEEALAAIADAKPDLIISDIMMPDHDGYWLIEQVRKLEPEQGRETPAIALTALATRQDRSRAVAAGFQMHIPKPPVPEQLLKAISMLAHRPIRSQ
jgi:CheY-like chemotaxis protein